MTVRENTLRAVEFRHPDWIPCAVGFSLLTWHTYREELERVVLRHPRLFPEYQPGSVDCDQFPPVYRQGQYFRDNWGCVWYSPIGGLEGLMMSGSVYDDKIPLANTEALCDSLESVCLEGYSA